MRFVKWVALATVVAVLVVAGVGLFVSYGQLLDDIDSWLGSDV